MRQLMELLFVLGVLVSLEHQRQLTKKMDEDIRRLWKMLEDLDA